MMPAVVIFTTILLLGLAVLWDWARVQIHWRGLQTATDAAALSAALSGERWTQLYITRYIWVEHDPCCDGNTDPSCTPCPYYKQDYDDIPDLRGRDAELFAAGGWGPEGWRTRANCANYDGCIAEILDRWVEYDWLSAEQAAQAAFNANAREMGMARGGFAWELDWVSVEDRFGPASRRPPEPGWCSRLLEEDTVEVEAHGTTTFDLLPSLAGLVAQRYHAWSTARGAWPGVTTPVHPPDRPEVWRSTWDDVCR
nr:MAG: hypothetical protein DIU70_07920 [Bacillota bacterium]